MDPASLFCRMALGGCLSSTSTFGGTREGFGGVQNNPAATIVLPFSLAWSWIPKAAKPVEGFEATVSRDLAEGSPQQAGFL